MSFRCDGESNHFMKIALCGNNRPHKKIDAPQTAKKKEQDYNGPRSYDNNEMKWTLAQLAALSFIAS